MSRMADRMQSRYKNILVTGGCGFCGGEFVRHVVDHAPDTHVTVLDKLAYAADMRNIEGLPAERVCLVVGDICDRGLLERVMPEHDAIAHFLRNRIMTTRLPMPSRLSKQMSRAHITYLKLLAHMLYVFVT